MNQEQIEKEFEEWWNNHPLNMGKLLTHTMIYDWAKGAWFAAWRKYGRGDKGD